MTRIETTLIFADFSDNPFVSAISPCRSVRLQYSSMKLQPLSVRFMHCSVMLHCRSVGLQRSSVILHCRSVRLHCRSVRLQRSSVLLHCRSVRLHCRTVRLQRSSVSLQCSSGMLQRSSAKLQCSATLFRCGCVQILSFRDSPYTNKKKPETPLLIGDISGYLYLPCAQSLRLILIFQCFALAVIVDQAGSLVFPNKCIVLQ